MEQLTRPASISNRFVALAVGAGYELLAISDELWHRRGRGSFAVARPFEAKIDVTGMHQQQQSPLFAIPGEIRSRVFEYVFGDTTMFSEGRSYHRFHFRPDQKDWQGNHTALLRTCKRVFQENRLSPVALVEHTFWLDEAPKCAFPDSRAAAGQWRRWQEWLNPAQREAVRQVRFYTRAVKLHELDLRPGLRCRELTLVIRELSRQSSPSLPMLSCSPKLESCRWLDGLDTQGLPRALNQSIKRTDMDRHCSWGDQLCLVDGLKVLKIQLEVHDSRKEELEMLLQHASFWRFPILGGIETLVHKQTRQWTWRERPEPKADQSVPASTFIVAEMTWGRRKADKPS